VVVVAGGALKAVVGGLDDEVDSKADNGNVEPGCGVAQWVSHHRVPPPLVPPRTAGVCAEVVERQSRRIPGMRGRWKAHPSSDHVVDDLVSLFSLLSKMKDGHGIGLNTGILPL
jgi:hypothetical protein